MTWSLIAKDPKSGAIGVIVSSRFFACGAIVPCVGSSVAVASQAFCNPIWGTEGKARLENGEAADAVLDDLVSRDNGHAIRQAHLMDASGRFAAFTGADCTDWAGHLISQDHSVAGNMLAGQKVLQATSQAYQSRDHLPFPERLIRAMQSGEEAGGDKRGKQAAGLIIHKGEDYAWLDLRADDHADPLGELARLWDVAQERYVHFAKGLPTAGCFSGSPTRDGIDADIAAADALRASQGRSSRSQAVDS